MDDYLIHTFDFVTVGNRTASPLNVTFDGRSYKLKPYPETQALPKVVAQAACRQHPVMGTEDPYHPLDIEYLVYVKEWGLPDSPIEQSDAKERLNRSLLPAAAQHVELRATSASRPERPTAGLNALFEAPGGRA
jgi:hypothetical protein